MLNDKDNLNQNNNENFENDIIDNDLLNTEGDESQIGQQDEEPEANSIENKIKELEQQIVTLKDQHLRALAENENIRKRAERDRQDASLFAISQFARDLLGVADNLSRALIAMEQHKTPEVKPLLDGVEITDKELMKVFEKHQIKKLYPLHVIFNPKLHQAMFEIEHDQHPAGTITEVLQAGYTLNERLLRPAMVGVVKSKA